MTTAHRPRYVERPGDPIWPPPYELCSVRLRCYWLAADPDRVAALCRACFDEPTAGAVRVRPAGAGVALMFAHIGSVRAPHVAPPAVTDERDAGFWVPVRVEQPGVAPPRVAWFLPHLFVDEPNALMIGREGSGFPKCLADAILVPWADGARDTARVTARVRDPGSPEGRLAPRTVIEVAPTPGAVASRARAAASLPTLLEEMTGGRLAALRMHVENVVARREVPLLLLRQLRALDDPTRAAHQEIVWLDNRVTRLGAARVLGAPYEIELGDPSALPVAAALGLRPGRRAVDAAIEAELDFAVPGQSALWTAHATPVRATAPCPRRPDAPGRTRVAILGGGIAGLAAAWRLLSAPGGAERFEVTVYEKDHRLGGKCASGRDVAAHGQRILEHGLHMWFGCYEESFRLLREVYADQPGVDWREVFTPQSVFEFWDPRADGEWRKWRLAFPGNDLTPGDGGPLADGPALVRSLGRWLSTAFEMALVPLAKRTDPASAVATLSRNLLRSGVALLGRLTRGFPAGGGARDRRATRVLAALHARLRALGDAWLAGDDEARQLYVTVDLGLAALRGIVADRLLARGFQSVDGEDLRAWLARHGASARSLDAAPVRALYDMTFAYRDGDRARPALAAGTGLHAILGMLFAYSGAVAWRMRGSMGDVVCAPLYEALRRRGVRFEFFHEVERVVPAGAGDAIESVELRRCARPVAGAYDPLVEAGGGARCWPERPRAEHLAPCDARVVLARGRDFDHVVLAVPPAVLERVAAPLSAQRPAWRAMLAGVGSVATAAAQLWFARPLSALRPECGAAHAGGGDPGEPVVRAGLAGPWDTWADMTHTLAVERWSGPAAPRAVVYGCGPITDDAAARCASPEARAAMLAGYLDAHAAALWPGAVARCPDGRPRFDPGALAGTGGAAGDAPTAAQYVRLNTHGSERYVQSLPGSTTQRLAPDGSGYANLWLAGDWTRTGFDIGSVEAAVRSASLAARALATRVATVPDARPLIAPLRRDDDDARPAAAAAVTHEGGRV
jgi:uncharacterized protein with NAD-binding domain and iron-sulfur cluster